MENRASKEATIANTSACSLDVRSVFSSLASSWSDGGRARWEGGGATQRGREV